MRYSVKDKARSAKGVSQMHDLISSGDILTPAPDQPEVLQPRTLSRASIGDPCVIEGAGAYCAAMPAKNYNSFPEAAEILLRQDGNLQLIRKRQTLDQILQNEVAPE